MKTISECFLHIAIMCSLDAIVLLCLVADIVTGNWIGAIFLLFVLVMGIWAIRSAYKTAKRIEESMRHCVDLTILISEPKDKEDEVEADK